MSSEAPSFLQRCLAGETAPDAIDDAVEAWHEGGDERDLPAYLGMTEDEYWRWVRNPDELTAILAERSSMRPGGLAA
jgi:hypothetical protein